MLCVDRPHADTFDFECTGGDNVGFAVDNRDIRTEIHAESHIDIVSVVARYYNYEHRECEKKKKNPFHL